MVRIPTPESGALSACLGLLAAERIWHERRNTRTMWTRSKDRRTGRERERPVFFGRPGTADIHCMPKITLWASGSGQWWLEKPGISIPTLQFVSCVPWPVWVETKSDIGTQTADQRIFQQEVEAAGHIYLLARSSDVLKEWLINHGAMRRK